MVLFLFVSPSHAGLKNKKEKIIPIYFYENVNKKDFFNKVDEYMQKKKYQLSMYYPELGFMQVQGKDISILIKQFGNDIYLLVYPPEKQSGKLEEIHSFTENMAKYMNDISQNSYPIIDEHLYKELQTDIKQIKTTRKTSIPDDTYNSEVYIIDTKRYVGYKKYKPSKFDKAKQKAQHKIDKQYYKQKEKTQKYLERQQKKETNKKRSV